MRRWWTNRRRFLLFSGSLFWRERLRSWGIWIGSLSYAPHWAALALAIGAGAILQVIVEVGGYLKRRAGPGDAWFTPSTLAGLTLGIAIMYVTAIFVKV